MPIESLNKNSSERLVENMYEVCKFEKNNISNKNTQRKKGWIGQRVNNRRL